MLTNKPVKIRHPQAEVSFKHNFLPPLIGLFVTLLVFGGLNSQWIAAEWRYRYIKTVAAAAPIIPKTDDGTKIPLAPAELKISKIGVDAPIIVDLASTAEYKVQLALRTGVVRYGTTALPGQNGNTVIVGHSSGQVWAPGNYKFVFTLLNKLQDGDLIQVDYNGTRYIYKVVGEKVVLPTDVTVLAATDKPTLTLITCTPVGTSNKRLVVNAEQISPNPNKAEQSQTTTPSKIPAPTSLPGNTPSLWRQIKDSL